MPPGANEMPAPAAPPPAGAAEADSKKRKTKWDEPAANLPDWLQDLVPKPPPAPRPPPGVDPDKFKVLKLEGPQVRALIGKGGETIRGIRTESGADIKIDHNPQDPEGTVTIVGDVERVENMIKETLERKGCPLGGPKPPLPPAPGLPGLPGRPPLALPPMPPGVMAPPLPGGLLPPGPEMDDIVVAPELVVPLIGPGGAHIKDVRAKVGGNVYISVLPPAVQGGPQSVRIVGENKEVAKELVRAKIEELKKIGPMLRPPGPGAPLAIGVGPAPPVLGDLASSHPNLAALLSGTTLPSGTAKAPSVGPGLLGAGAAGLLGQALGRPLAPGLGGLNPRVVGPPAVGRPGFPALRPAAPILGRPPLPLVGRPPLGGLAGGGLRPPLPGLGPLAGAGLPPAAPRPGGLGPPPLAPAGALAAALAGGAPTATTGTPQRPSLSLGGLQDAGLTRPRFEGL